METKPQLTPIPYQGLWDNVLAPHLADNPPLKVPLCFRYLFCGSLMCYQRVAYQQSFKDDMGHYTYHRFRCRNCQAGEIVGRDSSGKLRFADRDIDIPHYNIMNFWGHQNYDIFFLHPLPEDPVYKMVEVTQGAIAFSTTVQMSPDELVAYYLRDLMSVKDVRRVMRF